MTYQQNYYYYYKYPPLQTTLGVPLGIGICVLALCFSMMCQQKRRQLREQQEEESRMNALEAESHKYHTLEENDCQKVKALQNVASVSMPVSSEAQRSDRTVQKRLDIQTTRLGFNGITSANEQASEKQISPLDRMVGDWEGYTMRAASIVTPDSVYFQFRGKIVEGTHFDHMGAYSVDGIVDSEGCLNFSKIYAKSGVVLEYECNLVEKVCL